MSSSAGLAPPPGGRTTAAPALAFSTDLRLLATGNDDEHVNLWDLTDRAGPRRVGSPMIVAGHTDTVFAMAFAPDAHILATGGKDGSTILWDLAGPQQPPRRCDGARLRHHRRRSGPGRVGSLHPRTALRGHLPHLRALTAAQRP
jgi:WD40 repeat protein